MYCDFPSLTKGNFFWYAFSAILYLVILLIGCKSVSRKSLWRHEWDELFMLPFFLSAAAVLVAWVTKRTLELISCWWSNLPA